MLKLPFITWIANAAASLTGAYGDVTRQAEVADCSRQTIYDHAQKVQDAVEDAHDGGPTRAQLIEQNQRLRHENAQLWDWLAATIEFPPSKQQEFTVTACAMGLSLNQVLVLLALILGKPACPGRSTLHRWIKAAGLAAGRVLEVLDAQCRVLVLVGCLDEIYFHRRPVLVAVEPASMTWFLGQKAHDCSGATWAKSLRHWSALSYVTADAGSGLQAGIATVQQERQTDGQPALENGLDVFHTTQEAKRVLRQNWNHVERCWEPAEAATRRVEQAQRQGQDARGAAVAARSAWKKAEAAFRQYERSEAGWKIAHDALAVFRPEGQLNDRAWAKQQISLACRCCRVGSGPRCAASSRRRRRGRSWTVSTVSCAKPSPRIRCVRSWCGCGGCVGNGPERTPRERLWVRVMWRIWCNRWSATRGTRTGGSRTRRCRACCV